MSDCVVCRVVLDNGTPETVALSRVPCPGELVELMDGSVLVTGVTHFQRGRMGNDDGRALDALLSAKRHWEQEDAWPWQRVNDAIKALHATVRRLGR